MIEISATNVTTGTTAYVDLTGTQAWTANAYIGYGLTFVDGSGTCDSDVKDKWYGITSNSAENLFYAPTPADASTITNCAAKLTNFHLSEDSPALAAGADFVSGSQPATPQINIGAKLGYITNGASKYNFLQQAEDDDAYSAGDTINIYGYEYIASGTVGSTLTDNGSYITIDVDDNALTASNQHEGMYMFMTAGTNSGKYYLIIDSAETTTDTISLYVSATTGFAQNDTFKIVDRIYDHQGSTTNSANLSLSSSGSQGSEIIWTEQGTGIISADNNLDYTADWSYNVFGETAVNYVKIDKNITLYVPGSTSALGGETYATGTSYYCYQSCNTAPTNTSLDLLSHADGAEIFAGQTYTWQAAVSDADGYADLGTVVLHLDYDGDDQTITWTQATDAFSESSSYFSDATSTSSCASNSCTLNFNLTMGWNWTNTDDTATDAQLVTTDDSAATDTDFILPTLFN